LDEMHHWCSSRLRNQRFADYSPTAAANMQGWLKRSALDRVGPYSWEPPRNSNRCVMMKWNPPYSLNRRSLTVFQFLTATLFLPPSGPRLTGSWISHDCSTITCRKPEIAEHKFSATVV